MEVPGNSTPLRSGSSGNSVGSSVVVWDIVGFLSWCAGHRGVRGTGRTPRIGVPIIHSTRFGRPAEAASESRAIRRRLRTRWGSPLRRWSSVRLVRSRARVRRARVHGGAGRPGAGLRRGDFDSPPPARWLRRRSPLAPWDRAGARTRDGASRARRTSDRSRRRHAPRRRRYGARHRSRRAPRKEARRRGPSRYPEPCAGSSVTCKAARASSKTCSARFASTPRETSSTSSGTSSIAAPIASRRCASGAPSEDAACSAITTSTRCSCIPVVGSGRATRCRRCSTHRRPRPCSRVSGPSPSCCTSPRRRDTTLGSSTPASIHAGPTCMPSRLASAPGPATTTNSCRRRWTSPRASAAAPRRANARVTITPIAPRPTARGTRSTAGTPSSYTDTGRGAVTTGVVASWASTRVACTGANSPPGVKTRTASSKSPRARASVRRSRAAKIFEVGRRGCKARVTPVVCGRTTEEPEMILPRRIALSLMLTVLGSFGCAHAPASSTAAAAEPMPDAYDGAERLELEASAPAPVVADADYGSDDVAQKKHAELAAPGPRTTAPEEASGGTGETPAVAAPDLEPSDRYLVYTANMTISVFDRDRALRDAERLPDRFGGYV